MSNYNIKYVYTGMKDEEGKDLYRILCNGVEIDVQTWEGIESYYPEWSIKLQYDELRRLRSL